MTTKTATHNGPRRAWPPLWLVGLLKQGFAGRFLLARLTRLPLLNRAADHMLFGGDDIIYLPKDNVIPIGESIATPGDVVLPSRVVEHFVLATDSHWIMDRCICRDASHCRDYPVDLGCLFLGEPALGINPRLGHRATRAEALEHVQRCREAGLVHMVGRNRLDSLWLGARPGHKLLSICHCCPCCCLWKVLPQLDPTISRKITRMPGVELRVSDRCTGCGRCTQGVCFVDAIRVRDGRAVIGADCRGCGRCAEVCPQQAIELTVSDGRFVERAIERLAARVDLG